MKTRSFPFVLTRFFLFACLAGSIGSSPAQKPQSQPQQPLTTFIKSYRLVDSLANAGLPKSALEMVKNIYRIAKREKNDPEYIKAVIYKAKLQSEFREDFITETIRELKSEIDSATEPGRQILNSILAEVYWKYYQNNRYRLRDRSQVKDAGDDSIQNWDLTTLSAKIISTYHSSLENAVLLKTKLISEYQGMLEKTMKKKGDPDPADRRDPFRPALYDFLAWRALDYFMSTDGPAQISANAFAVDDPGYFGQTKDFLNMKIKSAGDPNPALDYFAIKVFRDLSAFHFNDKDPQALIDEELQRFSFVLERSTVFNKDSLYFSALKRFEKDYLFSPGSTDISYAIANFLYTRGQQYNPNTSDRYKWELKSASEYCQSAIGRFPKSDGAKNCRTLEGSIRQSSLEVTTEYAVNPGKPSLGLLAFRNIPSAWFRIVIADPEEIPKRTSSMKREEILKYFLSLPVAKTWTMTLPSDGDLQKHRAEISIPDLPEGYYILLCSSNKEFNQENQALAYAFLYSTQISYISQRAENGGYNVYILDRETGLPLQDVAAEAWTKVYNYGSRTYESRKINDFKTDENGFFFIPALATGSNYSGFFMKLKRKNDLFITDNLFQYPIREQPPRAVLQTTFFTDRAIYRPGQTIYFKGILLEQTGDNHRIMPGRKTTVTFTDANYQKISEQTFVTNEFGSFNGYFIVPRGVLPGQMNISNGSGSISVSVEEYKRPTFEVLFDPLEGNYRLNDSISLSGKAVAYAGNKIDGATLNYRVQRTVRFPYWSRGWYIPFPVSPEIEIANGTTMTDADGKFQIKFKAIPDALMSKSGNPVFDYQIIVDVTDLNGETRSNTTGVSAGYVSLLIGSDIPEKVSLSTDTAWKLTATNLNGRPTQANVAVSFFRLRQPDRVFRPRYWERPDLNTMTRKEFYSQFPYDIYNDEDDPGKWPVEETVFEKVMNTARDSMFKLSAVSDQPSILKQGTYLLVLKAKDPFGQEVESKSYITLYSPGSKEMPANALNWFLPLKTSGVPGEKAQFLIGSKEENVNVVYEIQVHDSLQSRRWLKMNDGQMLVEIPISENCRGNFSVNFVFIKHNRAFQNSQTITVPYDNKKLDITFATFRNKLLPGSSEEWKIIVTDAAKKGAEAEFLTAMYDESLDALAPNNWYFSIFRTWHSFSPWDFSNSFRRSSGTWYPSYLSAGEFIFRDYPRLNWFGLNYFGSSGRFLDRSKGVYAGSSNKTMEQAVPSFQADGITTMNAGGAKTETEKEKTKDMRPAATAAPQVRRDFRETAFFYPSLLTDKEGNLVVRFTVPESLTKWKILGFAHTRHLDYGQVEKEVITQKELMVFPNTPRFVRQGDTVIFSTKVVNLSDHTLSGEVSLDLTDPVSGDPVNLVISDQQSDDSLQQHPVSFTLNKSQSQSVEWKLAIPIDPSLSLLQYRVTAKAGNFSDAEEKAFPVLTNRMLVTESLPLPVRGKGSFSFSLDKLLQSASLSSQYNTLKNYRLTFEFASNPAWYAVQALSALDEPSYPNADNIFNAFYANSIATFIANSNPKIQQVFESWKKITPDALLSNLEKNQQLKSVLLQETPWVMEARSESERKQRLALLFDLNTLSNRLNDNMSRLKKLQSTNGAWPWFENMPESRYITQNIVTGLGRLDHLGIKNIRDDIDTWSMVTKALRYLDGELVKDYEDLKKNFPEKIYENHLTSAQIQYLYARSYFIQSYPLSSGIQHPASGLQQAIDYYKTQAAKYWLSVDIYFQGMIALALDRLQMPDIPKSILRSLSEKAQHSPEMGMYWVFPGGYEWYQAPVETQAMMIEAYDEVSADKDAVEEMKVWLLKQKQVQDWKTSRATAEACYALLLRGIDLLAGTPAIKVNIGSNKIDAGKLTDNKSEAGTGYFQVTWSGQEITPDMGNVKIFKPDDGIAWGALYWQYFENLDKITPHQTPLHVVRKLFLEKNTPAGPVIQEIANGGSLSVGDKIKVRIILSVDRTMEFVHMKDMRASALEPGTTAARGFPSPFAEGPGAGLSGYHYQDGLGYYQSTTDVATNFFFDYLPKGQYVFEYPLVVNASGDYSNGITTIQCMYAPEFSAHSEGIRVKVN